MSKFPPLEWIINELPEKVSESTASFVQRFCLLLRSLFLDAASLPLLPLCHPTVFLVLPQQLTSGYLPPPLVPLWHLRHLVLLVSATHVSPQGIEGGVHAAAHGALHALARAMHVPEVCLKDVLVAQDLPAHAASHLLPRGEPGPACGRRVAECRERGGRSAPRAGVGGVTEVGGTSEGFHSCSVMGAVATMHRDGLRLLMLESGRDSRRLCGRDELTHGRHNFKLRGDTWRLQERSASA